MVVTVRPEEKARAFPQKSGCYLMKDKEGRVLYVGKAKCLRSRVLSYFTGSHKGPRIQMLVSQMRDVDFQLTKTEAEALILENTLIKKHAPKYNVMMRDDKSYPYVVVDKTELFPRLVYKRRPKRKKGVEVYGPFVHGSKIKEVLRIIIKSFGLRDCSLREFRSRKSPCLLYQIKQCHAPCVGFISDEEYAKNLEFAVDIFRGKGASAIEFLEKVMNEAGEKEEFEYAAIVRDYIKLLRDFIQEGIQENAEICSRYKNIDILSYYSGGYETDITMYIIRNSLLLGHKSFYIPTDTVGEHLEDDIINFFFQYYTQTHDILPDLAVVPFADKRREVFSKAINNALGVQKTIRVSPAGKKFASLISLAGEHSREHQRIRLEEKEHIVEGHKKLQELLKLRKCPMRLECYDVAVFQGTSPTASRIVFVEGRPVKKDYRHYRLQKLSEGNNDFAMMKEVIGRRLKENNLPDVFIVDGGRGQMKAFIEVLKDFDVSVPVVGLAKARSRGRSSAQREERLFIPGRVNPYILKKNPKLSKILVQMRDEAHRFAGKLHSHDESQRVISSWLDQVSGIGPQRRKEILKHLDILPQELAQKSVSEVQEYLNVGKKTPENILRVCEHLL